MKKNFLFGEHRLAFFAPATPPQQPEQQESSEKVDGLKATAENVSSFPEAKAKVQELIAKEEAAQVKDSAEVQQYLIKAGNIAYGEKLAGQMVDNQALDEVNAMFAPALDAYDLQFVDDNGDGNLELLAEAPKTTSEALEQRIKSAMAKMKSGDIGSMLSAAFEMFGALQAYLQAAKNGTLEDAFESPRSKESRERQERRDKLRNELNGKDFAKALAEKKAAETIKKTEVQTAKQTVKDAEKDIETTTADLQKAEAADPKDQAKVDALKAELETQQKALATAKEDLATRQQELSELTQTIEDLEQMQKESKLVEDKVRIAMEIAGQAYLTSQDLQLKALGEAMTTADVVTTGDLKIKVTANGKPFGDHVRDLMGQAGVTDLPSNGRIGVDAQGHVVAMNTFTNFLGTEMNTQVKEQIKESAAKSIAESTEDFIKDNKEFFLNTVLANEGSWKDMSSLRPDTECVYVSGKIFIQAAADPTSLTEVPLDGSPATESTPQTGKYFDGAAVVDLLEQDVAKLNKFYTFDSNGEKREWRKKTIKEVFDELPRNLSNGAREALASPNATDWPKDGNWEFHYDGDQNLYGQHHESPMRLVKLDIEAYVNGDADYWEKFSGQYFNGTDEPKAIPEPDQGKLKRGYKWENHEWTEKTTAEVLKYAFKDHIDKAIDEPGKRVASATNPNIEYIMAGEDMYRQNIESGDALERYDVDTYIDSGEDKYISVGDSYVNGSGEVVKIPNQDTHTYNKETHTWETDSEKAINTLALEFQEDFKEIAAANEGEWVDDLGGGYTGVRVGNMLYRQSATAPETVQRFNLEDGHWDVDLSGQYFNGTDLVDVPASNRRGSYNQDTHTWKELSSEQADSRFAKRLSDGANVLNNLSGGLTSTSDSETQWHVNLGAGSTIGEIDDVQVRLNSNTHKWEYTHEDDAQWVSVQKDATQYDDNGVDDWSETSEQEVESVLKKLRPIDNKYEDG